MPCDLRRCLTTVVALATSAGGLSSLSAQGAPPAQTVSVGQLASEPKTSLTADAGYVATSGNTNVTSVNIGQRLAYGRARWRLEQTFGIVYGENEGIENVNLLRATVGAQYGFRPRVALATGVLYDRNRFAGIARRTEQYAGLVFRVLETSRDTLRLDAGASLTQQLGVDGVQNNFPAARTAAWYKRSFGPNAFFLQTAEVIPNLDVTEDYRINTESALVAPLSRRLALKLGYLIRFDNLPEVGFATTDRIFSSGLQVSF